MSFNSENLRVFTICTTSHLPQALTCLESLPNNIPKTIWLCNDRPSNYPTTPGIEIRLVSELPEALKSVKARQYNPFELVCCLKPYISLVMSKESDPAALMMYVDSDIFFYTDPNLICFPGNFCFFLTPHFTSSPPDYSPNLEIQINQVGLFNAGFYIFRTGLTAEKILYWWWSRVREKCYNSIQNGQFVDQIWLNYFPLYFPKDIFVSRQNGINTGHWNLHLQKIKNISGDWTSNKEPLICFHFSGYQLKQPNILSKHQVRLNFSNSPELRHLFKDYHQNWTDCKHKVDNHYKTHDYLTNKVLKQDPSTSEKPLVNLYFLADIFVSPAAGIYRYSLEMAHRFHKDDRVNLQFVSSGENAPDLLNKKLKILFGDKVQLHNKRKIFGHILDENWLSPFQSAFSKHPKHTKTDKRAALHKILRVIFRAFSKIEKNIHQRLPISFSGPKPILFSSYGHIGSLLNLRRKPFYVHVVHDIIPIISPEHFNSNEHFIEIFNNLAKANLLLTVSENTRNDLIRHNDKIQDTRIHPIPIAASDHFVAHSDYESIRKVKLKYDIPLESDYILTVCTIEPRKNHLRLVRAWKSIYSQLNLSSPKLVIIGSSGWGTRFQKEVNSATEGDNSIIMTGFVDDTDLPLLYSGCTFSIYPSLYEGFGLPILESMASGRFCLTSRTSSMPELTSTDVPLVDPYSTDSIAEGILHIANNPEYRYKLEKVAIQRSKLFSWERTYSRTLEIITRANSNHNSPSQKKLQNEEDTTRAVVHTRKCGRNLTSDILHPTF
jgi:glycosyltransferase involved in cell wall biosynthesis